MAGLPVSDSLESGLQNLRNSVNSYLGSSWGKGGQNTEGQKETEGTEGTEGTEERKQELETGMHVSDGEELQVSP